MALNGRQVQVGMSKFIFLNEGELINFLVFFPFFTFSSSLFMWGLHEL